jgi:hypothetical protein
MARLVLTAAALALALATAAGASGCGSSATAAAPGTPATQQATGPSPYHAALHVTRTIGPRPSAGPGERRAQRYAAARFRAAGLRAGWERAVVARATSSGSSTPPRAA